MRYLVDEPPAAQVLAKTADRLEDVYAAMNEHNARVAAGNCTRGQLDESRRRVLALAKRVPGLAEIVRDEYNYAVDRFTPAGLNKVYGIWNQFETLSRLYSEHPDGTPAMVY